MSALDATAIDTVRRQIDALKAAVPELWDDPDEQFIHDMLEGSTSFVEIMTAIEERLGEDEALADAIKARRDQLREREDRVRDRIERMRGLALSLMEAAGQTRLMLPGATLSVRNTPPKVVVIDEAGIPDEFWKTTRTLNKTALAEALKSGVYVDGAALGNGGRALSVRRT